MGVGRALGSRIWIHNAFGVCPLPYRGGRVALGSLALSIGSLAVGKATGSIRRAIHHDINGVRCVVGNGAIQRCAIHPVHNLGCPIASTVVNATCQIGVGVGNRVEVHRTIEVVGTLSSGTCVLHHILDKVLNRRVACYQYVLPRLGLVVRGYRRGVVGRNHDRLGLDAASSKCGRGCTVGRVVQQLAVCIARMQHRRVVHPARIADSLGNFLVARVVHVQAEVELVALERATIQYLDGLGVPRAICVVFVNKVDRVKRYDRLA